jgi:urocanate hydratase
MLYWDVNNGIARRSWARNERALSTLKRETERNPLLNVTVPYRADDKLIAEVLK